MQSYRITFAHNYSSLKKQPVNFYELFEVYSPIIWEIYDKARQFSIPYIWHFFEPHVEVTWLSDNDVYSWDFIAAVRDVLAKHKITDMRTCDPGHYGDWFCESEDEREFGSKRHDLCRRWIELYLHYQSAVDQGKGVAKQVERTIHTLCNPLGLNYWDEAKICLSRGVLCLLFILFNFKTAVWIYKTLLRQRY